jgi:hypothetical protein
MFARDVADGPYHDKYVNAGYKIPKAVSKKITPMKIFNNLIQPIVQNIFTKPAIIKALDDISYSYSDSKANVPISQYCLNELPGSKKNAGPACAELLRKVINFPRLYKYLWYKLVLRPYFFAMVDKGLLQVDGNNVADTYKLFKAEVASGKSEAFQQWFTQTYFDNTRRNFNKDVISLYVVLSQFEPGYQGLSNNTTDKEDPGNFRYDEDDLEHGFPLLVGLDNFNAPDFVEAMTDDNVAKQILAELREGNEETRNLVNEWKQNANNSSAVYLSETSPLFLAMFINEAAYNDYKAKRDAHVNVLIEPTLNGFKLANVPINVSFAITPTSPRAKSTLSASEMLLGDLD